MATNSPKQKSWSVAILIVVVLIGVGTAAVIGGRINEQEAQRQIESLLTVPTRAVATTSIAGWTKFQGGGAELWLPQNWEGGDLNKDFDAIVQRFTQRGAEFKNITQLLQQYRSQYVLFAIDVDSVSTGFATNVTVTKQQTTQPVTPSDYLREIRMSLPHEFSVVDTQNKVSLDRYDAGRILVRSSANSAVQLSYVIQVGKTIWVVGYATSASELDKRLPVFDQSIRSFYVYP